MLTEKVLKKYAEVLLWGLKTARRNPFRKGDAVRINFEAPALRLAELLQAELLKQGLNPVVRLMDTPVMERGFYTLAADHQLAFIPAGTREFNNALSGSITLTAPESLTHLKDANPKRIGKSMVARKPLREILWRREEKGLFGWTLCSLPTQALADKAGMRLADYAGQIVQACYLDKANPVAEWERIYRKVTRIKEWLDALDILTLRVESASMDVSVRLGEKRRFLGVSGHNIPSFEIFTSPDWRGTQGVYYANLPSYHLGNRVEGVRLEFKAGSVVRASARKGELFLKKMLAMDKFANKVGEFSLTDRRFSRIDRFMADTLFDENHGGKFGNCHLAVGSAYTDTFKGNPAQLTKARKKALGFNDSALHWDLVNTEKKRVTAVTRKKGSLVIYEDGVFQAD